MSAVRVVHVLPHPGGGAETYIDRLERMAGVSHRRVYLSSGRAPSRAALAVPIRWPGLARASRQADLIHAHGDVASVLALPLLIRRPSVLTTHGLHLLRRARPGPRSLLARSLRGAVAASQVVICTSTAERDELLAVVRAADRPKLTVIHPGIELPATPEPGMREMIRDQLGITSETVLGLFAGQLEPRKGPLLAAGAARRAREAGVPFVLIVAGDGPLAADLARLADDVVRPVGYRNDLPHLLSAADIFLQPSEREGLSIALLQAMGHGLAIVASDGAGNPEAVGDCALLFRVGDEAALTQSILRLSRDPELRASLGRAARARALSEFGSKRFVELTEMAYRAALRGSTG